MMYLKSQRRKEALDCRTLKAQITFLLLQYGLQAERICVMAVCFLRSLRNSFGTIDSHVPNTMSFPSRNKPLQQSLQNHG